MLLPELHVSVEGLIVNLSKKSGFEETSAEVRRIYKTGEAKTDVI
jgi:hypothetical protein